MVDMDSETGPATAGALWLQNVLCPAAKSTAESTFQLAIRSTIPEQFPEVQYAIIIQAGFQNALGGDADAVTGAAKTPAIRGDDTHGTLVAGNAVTVSGGIGPISQFIDRGVMSDQFLQDAAVIPGELPEPHAFPLKGISSINRTETG